MVVGRGGGRHRDVGDDDASELFRALYPSLRAFAAAVGSSEIEPDDLVQEALSRTLRRHRLVDLESPGPYLRAVILNLATSATRRRTSRLRAWTGPVPPTGAVDPMPSDLADLDRLGPLDRAVLYLVHVEGYPHQEVGDILGITEQASRSRASRATARLRREITAEEAAS
jgi:DNA-directed RNA polymerase specialized sigma24 family protein